VRNGAILAENGPHFEEYFVAGDTPFELHFGNIDPPWALT
jgi:hypothetical protein